MSDTQKEIWEVESHIFDAIEKCQEYNPATVIFAAVGLLTRMAHDFAPSERAANDLLSLAMGEAFEGEAESLHTVMDYAPEFKEAIRRIDAGEPVNTTAAELGLTPRELLNVIGGALQ